MTDVITFANSVIAISDGVPATYDAAGFAALAFTDIGEVLSIGSRGRTYTDVSYKTLKERGTLHRKGSFDEPETPIEIGQDRDDAGQLILKTASDSDDNYAFRITYSNGEIDYFQGQVFSYVTNGGGPDDMRLATANVRIDRQGVVEA